RGSCWRHQFQREHRKVHRMWPGVRKTEMKREEKAVKKQADKKQADTEAETDTKQ
ncbi:unnamed protein product, partial [Lota lota]